MLRVNVCFTVLVSSWDGGRSSLDIEEDRDKERKKHWSENYDEEIDKGKVVKYSIFFLIIRFEDSNIHVFLVVFI